MQIQEKDLLWKFYCRYYDGKHPKHPKSICNYFWKSVSGFLTWIFLDISILFFIPVIAGLAILSYNHVDHGSPLMLAYFILMVVSWVLCFLRVHNQTKKTGDEKWDLAMAGLIFWLVITFAIAGTGVSGKKQDTAEIFFYGVLWAIFAEAVLLIGILAIVSIYYTLFTDNTNLGKNLRFYGKSVKDRVCPLVTPPESWETDELLKKKNNTDN